MKKMCSGAVWLALAGLVAFGAGASAWAGNPAYFKDKKCNAAFSRYLSCFEGKNLESCEAKLGKQSCEEEAARVRGDLAVAKANVEIFKGAPCLPETYRMIDKNTRAYQRLFNCRPK